MKKIKSSVLAMLSAATLLFSSCLGDSEYTPTLGFTGTPMGDLSSTVLLDNGLQVILSNVSAAELMNVDRIYVYGQVTDENIDFDQLKPGDKVTIVPQAAIVMDLFDELTGTDPFQNVDLTEIESLSWFTMGVTFNAINGYMNFALTGDCYTKLSSSGSSGTTSTLVTPNYYIYVSRIDTNAKIVDLEIGYDNREAECVDTEGKVKDGYQLNLSATFPLSFNAASLYNQLEGIADEETVAFNIYKVSKADDGSIERDKISLSNTSIQKSALKRTYRTY